MTHPVAQILEYLTENLINGDEIFAWVEQYADDYLGAGGPEIDAASALKNPEVKEALRTLVAAAVQMVNDINESY